MLIRINSPATSYSEGRAVKNVFARGGKFNCVSRKEITVSVAGRGGGGGESSCFLEEECIIQRDGSI